MECRHCYTELKHVFLDLGFAPPSNSYLTYSDLHRPETYYPLKLYVCESCWLVQTIDFAPPEELFNSDYAYFSSVSTTWMKHAKEYSSQIIDELKLSHESFVMEVASNDGYLLKNFVEVGIPCLGVEPTNSTADLAEKLNIPIIRDFFCEELAEAIIKKSGKADLIIGNNVLAHVPDINDFTRALKIALKSNGTITLEFPHLKRLIELVQFDTVYHEHFSYLSLSTVVKIFLMEGLRVYDVCQIQTHGGSLRVYVCHVDDSRLTSHEVTRVINNEIDYGICNLDTYKAFQDKCDLVKNNLLFFLLHQKNIGATVVAYGAAAKGCTFLNYAGIKNDLLPFVCDSATSKQGKYLPGTHIPIVHPDNIKEFKPNYVLILPWNLQSEIISQLYFIKDWGGKFVTVTNVVNIL